MDKPCRYGSKHSCSAFLKFHARLTPAARPGCHFVKTLPASFFANLQHIFLKFSSPFNLVPQNPMPSFRGCTRSNLKGFCNKRNAANKPCQQLGILKFP